MHQPRFSRHLVGVPVTLALVGAVARTATADRDRSVYRVRTTNPLRLDLLGSATGESDAVPRPANAGWNGFSSLQNRVVAGGTGSAVESWARSASATPRPATPAGWL